MKMGSCVSDMDVSDDLIGMMIVLIMVGILVLTIMNGHDVITKGLIVPFVYPRRTHK